MDAQLAEGQLSLDLSPVDDGPAQPSPLPEVADSPGRGQPTHTVEPTTERAVKGSALLTTREAASLLHVHPRTVQRLVERGELAAIRIGTAVRFDPTDVTAVISRLKRWSTTTEPRTVDTVHRGSGARVSFAKRLRPQQNEHRAAHA